MKPKTSCAQTLPELLLDADELRATNATTSEDVEYRIVVLQSEALSDRHEGKAAQAETVEKMLTMSTS